MQNPSRPSLSRLVLALGLCLASATSAHAADIASATASISSLRYRLIDLDLNDGITPTLSVGGNLVVTGFTTVRNADGFVEANPLDSDNSVSAPWFSSGTITWASSAPGASATLGSTLSNTVSLSSDALVASKNTYISTYGSQYQSVGPDGVLRYTTDEVTTTFNSVSLQQTTETFAQLPYAESVDEFGNQTFTEFPSLKISANTLLLLEGTLGLRVSADSQAFASVLGGALSSDLNNVSGLGHVSASAGIGIEPEFTQNTLPGGSTLEQSQSAYTVINQALSFDTEKVLRDWAPYDPEAVSPTTLTGLDSKAFAITFANTSLSDMRGYLSLQMRAESNAAADFIEETRVTTYGDPVPDTPVLPPVPGIPEPSTYALMGLGLVGIVLARRRLRPTHAA
jgi:PEP-CTERM motif